MPAPRDSDRTRFLATVSHELRSPLVAILGYADVLLDELREGTGTRTMAERIRRQGAHLLAMVDDILDLVRLERGEIAIHPLDGSLRKVVSETVAAFVSQAREKGLGLTFEARRDLPPESRFDPDRVRQIVRHLVDNAVKFTETGSVNVRLRMEGTGRALISVTDTGPGLSLEAFEELSGALVQADESLSRAQGGCGVGLALARAMARRLGGELYCEGGVGRGTTIRFRLPLELPRGRAGMGRARSGRLRGRVLLVDDSADNRRLIRRILERVGLEVEEAEDGRAGVEAALHKEFDLVVMDVQMPHLDGLSATRELRELGFEPPIMALTANTEPTAREQCLAAGCDDHLTKPVDRGLFLERITGLLDRPTE